MSHRASQRGTLTPPSAQTCEMCFHIQPAGVTVDQIFPPDLCSIWCASIKHTLKLHLLLCYEIYSIYNIYSFYKMWISGFIVMDVMCDVHTVKVFTLFHRIWFSSRPAHIQVLWWKHKADCDPLLSYLDNWPEQLGTESQRVINKFTKTTAENKKWYKLELFYVSFIVVSHRCMFDLYLTVTEAPNSHTEHGVN